ncbi:MAG: hypothetical protein AB7G13_26700, partial [Lautropia sp.]
TAVTRWCGERLDYSIAVEGLLNEQQRGRAAQRRPADQRPADVSAETPPLARTSPTAGMSPLTGTSLAGTG